MARRWVVAGAGLLGSLAVSAAIYWYTGQLFAFLFIPFVPLLLSRRGRDGDTRRCPECGYTTRREYAHCPRDGTPLE
jgi:hypothetical protein